MELIRATEQELDELLAFYQHVADNMGKSGLQQWRWGVYPSEEIIREDVLRGDLYYMRSDGALVAAVVFMNGQEPEYDSLTWSCGLRPGIFHRLGVHPSMQGAGMGGLVLDDVLQLLRRSGCDCVRCDTSEQNEHAIRLYEKLGFRRCGKIHLEGAEGDNITFDTYEDSQTVKVRLDLTDFDFKTKTGAKFTITIIGRKPGDLNQDGQVTIEDVTLLQRALAEFTELTPQQLKAADVNGDGKISIRDVTAMQRIIAEYQ